MKTLRTTALLALCAATFLAAAGARAETTTVQLRAVDDAYVDSFSPNTNFGTSLNTYVGDRASQAGGTCYSFYQFDISVLPDNVEILNAELWLCRHEKYGAPTQTYTVTAHKITTPGWDENTITWNAPPGYATAPSASVTGTFVPPGWDTWNVTADVAVTHPAALVGWAVKMNTVPWAWVNFYTSEHVPMPDYRPMLEITYGTVVPNENVSFSEVKALFR